MCRLWRLSFERSNSGMLAVALYEQSCSSQPFNETYCHRENASSQLGSSTLATSLNLATRAKGV